MGLTMSDAVLKAWHPEPAPQAKSHSRLGQTGTLALARSASLGAALFAGAAFLKGFSSAPPAPPVEASTPAPTWIDIIKPVRIFSLEAPELTNLPLAYSARRWSVGGREDVLAFGTLGTDQPGLRLRIYRSDADTTMRRPLYAALALQAAEAGLSIGHSGLPDLLATRFGPPSRSPTSRSRAARIRPPSPAAAFASPSTSPASPSRVLPAAAGTGSRASVWDA